MKNENRVATKIVIEPSSRVYSSRGLMTKDQISER